MRYLLVKGRVRQKDGSRRQEEHLRAIPDDADPADYGISRRTSFREMDRAPREHEVADGTSWRVDEEAKARADRAAKLAAMTRDDLVAHILAEVASNAGS